jgi:anhydro-N-acetylmuramic acid kinase
MVYPELNILGLMSGTSLDGVDICLSRIRISAQLAYEILAFETLEMPLPLRERLLRNMRPDTSSVDDICALNVELGSWFGHSVQHFLNLNSFTAEQIDLIGSHGQTLYHLPPGSGTVAASLQLGDAAVIAEMTGITTISDFRMADLAAGGQGAPLVPYVDTLIFQHPEHPTCLQNIGGMANLTFLGTHGEVMAFDTGPGNVLIDYLAFKLSEGSQRCDAGGHWASRGTVCSALLAQALTHPFFAQLPPKSTGREVFGPDFAEQFLTAALSLSLSSADILATATALTAYSIEQACRQFLPQFPERFVISGGGVHNRTLMQMISERLAPAHVLPMEHFGLSSDAKEAFAFACLAYTCLLGLPNNLPAVTGAARPVVMGKIQPGQNYLSLMRRIF